VHSAVSSEHIVLARGGSRYLSSLVGSRILFGHLTDIISRICRAIRNAWAKTQRPLPLSVSGGGGRGGGDDLGGECCVCMDAPIQAVSLLSLLGLFSASLFLSFSLSFFSLVSP
jgi:hypothetical protein